MFSSLLLLIWFGSAGAHSWLECTNYDPPSFEYDLLGYYERSRCSGYPRAFNRQFSAGFSVDTGYNWEHTTCRDQYNPDDYTSNIPMATYSAGQIIYLSHPSKNHVADTCTNAFIPDGGVEVRMSSELGVDTFDVSLSMVGDAHTDAQIDHLGFQRCFRFCENTDGAHCIMGWALPTDIANGVHSFIWTWEFNDGQFYTNCFDAIIISGGPSPSSTSSPSSPTPEVTTFELTTIPLNSSGSSSGSGFDNETISFPTVSSTLSPGSTENFTIETLPPTSVPTADSTSTPLTDSPSQIPDTAVEVITSSASSLSSPFTNITSYIINFVGNVSLNGVFNITDISNALLRL